LARRLPTLPQQHRLRGQPFEATGRWLLRRKIDHEIRLDMRILEGLADQSADIEGMKLSRFDKVLALNRERINRVYRGIEPHPWPVCGDRTNRSTMPEMLRCAGS
jgi:hypothetical protein